MAINGLTVDRLTGERVKLWPYARGIYARDILYRLWRVVEDHEAASKMFCGSQDEDILKGDLVSFVKYFDDPGRYLLIVTDLTGDDIAGCIWFDDLMPKFRAFGSVFMRQKYGGEGSMEAVRMALGYAYTVLEVESVWGVTPWRTAKQLCTRCGFEDVALLPAFARVNGLCHDVTILRHRRGA